MALFTQENLRARVRTQFAKGGINENTLQKAERILNESVLEQRTFSATQKTYDIFLSHSSSDAAIVAGLKLELEDLGYSVYVDWIEDPKLDRRKVTKETARLLQQRMQSCKSLFYAFTENASESKWMPWELGYFDGIKQKAAVLPISNGIKEEFKGTEYVGIYYYITKEINDQTKKDALWVNESKKIYVSYDRWINNNKQPFNHTTP
jgi:hypothetical protein